MNQVDGDRWEDFADWLDTVNNEWQKRKLGSMHVSDVSDLLFRGQSDARWSLQTVLERYDPRSLDAAMYYECIHAAKPQLESHTGHTWAIPSPSEYGEWLERQDSLGLFGMRAYEYLVHLRHHGFPSPLLDWSESPYVAAFFALNHATTHVSRIAVYAYLEYAGGTKSGSKQDPSVHGMGPYVCSHKRHFLQRSQYTVCTQFAKGRWRYASHDEALAKNDAEQDLLWKFTLPSTERLRALRYLDRFNLNAFSLFGSEESLMETVAMRTFHFQTDDL